MDSSNSYPQTNSCHLAHAPAPAILRETFLAAIERKARSGAPIILVDGERGIGVTTLLNQLATRDPSHTCALFINSASRANYDPYLLQHSLVAELRRLLGLNSTQDDPAPDSVLRDLRIRLTRHANHGQHYLFILDGLHQLPAGDSAVRDDLLQLLPIGINNIHAVIAGTSAHLPASVRGRLPIETVTLTGFTIEETLRYLDGLGASPAEVAQLYELGAHNPTYFSAVRRLVGPNTPLSRLISEAPRTFAQLYAIEWESLPLDDDRFRLALAILSFDTTPRVSADLGAFVEADAASLDVQLSRVSFLMRESATSPWRFVSEPARQYALSKLASLRAEAVSRIIKALYLTPDSRESLVRLPLFLTQLNQAPQLLEYLSPQRFADALRVLKSVDILQDTAARAIQAARSAARDDELLRFSLHRATLAEIVRTQVGRTEIEALLSLGDESAAMRLAQSAVVPEDRLQMMAAIGRFRRMRGELLDAAFSNSIGELADAMDVAALGERALSLAEDLVFTHPERALRLVDTLVQRNADRAQTDWFLARTSLVAPTVCEPSSDQASLSSLRDRIHDPLIRRATAVVAAEMSDLSIEAIQREAHRVADPQQRFQLLAYWVARNRTQPEASRVVSLALDTLANNASCVPDASALRRLASALRNYPDAATAGEHKRQLDSIATVSSRTIPSSEHVRLQIHLLSFEWIHEREAAVTRAETLVFYLIDIRDPPTRATCLAYAYWMLDDVDPAHELDKPSSIHEIVAQDLKRAIDDTLNCTADHYVELRAALRAIARRSVSEATSIAERLNTPRRRDAALSEILNAILDRESTPAAVLERLVRRVSDPEERDTMCQHIARWYSLSKCKLNASQVAALDEVVDLISNPYVKCEALVHLYHCRRLAQIPEHDVLQAMRKTWRGLDRDCRWVETGFQIVQCAAANSAEDGRSLLLEIEDGRRHLVLDSHGSTEAYVMCARLALIAFGALLKNRRDVPGDRENVLDLVNQVPSRLTRVILWTDVALRFDVARRPEAREIVAAHLRPLIADCEVLGTYYRESAIGVAAPALYVAHATSALMAVQSLPEASRNSAVQRIAAYLLRKTPPLDSFPEADDVIPALIYEEALDLIKLSEYAVSDSTGYWILESVALATVNKEHTFTRAQKLKISELLEEQARTKFPRPGHIEHAGYQILVHAQALRVKPHAAEREWDELLGRARLLPNESDYIYVLAHLVAMWPVRQRSGILKELMSRVECLRSENERLTRLIDISSILVRTEANGAERAIQAAAALVAKAPNQPGTFRRLIDAAYRIEPILAETIARGHDDDPARHRVNAQFRERLKLLEQRTEIARHGVDSECEGQSSETARSAWMAFGLLNARRSPPLEQKAMVETIERASALPLNFAFPMFALALTSARERFGGSEDSSRRIRALFGAACIGAEFARQVADRFARMARSLRREADGERGVAASIVPIGGQEFAIERIREWCQQNVKERLIICDPFFTPDNLHYVQLVQVVCPSVRIQILTSREVHRPYGEALESAYRRKWRLDVSEVPPPRTEVVVAGVCGNGKMPIHDRWWLTDDEGLRLGTSVGGLGNRVSEISRMDRQSVRDKLVIVEHYLARDVLTYLDERIEYSLFTL